MELKILHNKPERGAVTEAVIPVISGAVIYLHHDWPMGYFVASDWLVMELIIG